MPSHLPYVCVVPHRHPYEQAVRTFHHHFHIIDQTIYYIECLGNSHPGLFKGESIEAAKN